MVPPGSSRIARQVMRRGCKWARLPPFIVLGCRSPGERVQACSYLFEGTTKCGFPPSPVSISSSLGKISGFATRSITVGSLPLTQSESFGTVGLTVSSVDNSVFQDRVPIRGRGRGWGWKCL